MKIIESIVVPADIKRQRLSDYLVGKLKTITSRKGVKKAIKKGAVRVDGKIQNTAWWVETGQIIELLRLDKPPVKVFPMIFPVIFEDDYIAVINKPSGIMVSGNKFQTIENALLNNIKVSTQIDALRLPLPVHRLDSATNGLLIIAKTSKARIELGRAFEERKIQKKYQAIVIGQTPNQGKINEAIDEKQALTLYKTLQSIRSLRNDWLSLVEIDLKTGRTHQIRKHFKHIGHPLMGDQLYGEVGQILKGKGLFLSAISVAFHHPITNESIQLTIQPPNKFSLLLEREARRWKKFKENK